MNSFVPTFCPCRTRAIMRMQYFRNVVRRRNDERRTHVGAERVYSSLQIRNTKCNHQARKSGGMPGPSGNIGVTRVEPNAASAAHLHGRGVAIARHTVAGLGVGAARLVRAAVEANEALLAPRRAPRIANQPVSSAIRVGTIANGLKERQARSCTGAGHN
jgi:hypothetical protein